GTPPTTSSTTSCCNRIANGYARADAPSRTTTTGASNPNQSAAEPSDPKAGCVTGGISPGERTSTRYFLLNPVKSGAEIAGEPPIEQADHRRSPAHQAFCRTDGPVRRPATCI